MNFRRYYIPGSAVFITQLVQYREPVFHDPKIVLLLREILRNVKVLHPFAMLGNVFLPDHFHMMIQPTGKDNFSDIMRSLKTNFTKEYKKLIGLSPSQSMKFWQSDFGTMLFGMIVILKIICITFITTPSSMDMLLIRVIGKIVVTSNGKNAVCIQNHFHGKSRKILSGESKLLL